MASQNRDFHEIFEKVLAPASVPYFGRPCRGLRTLTGLRPQWQGGRERQTEIEFIVIRNGARDFFPSIRFCVGGKESKI